MDTLIISSMRENAGKTSLIVGLAKVLNRKFGYIKPLGDRLLYRKKQLWDYDSSLLSTLFKLSENPQDMSLGFDHAKLRFMYDQAGMQAKLQEITGHIGADLLFIEGGKELTYGASVHLDALSLARQSGGKLIIVVAGENDLIVDQIQFLARYLDLAHLNLAGLIINKLADVADFENSYLAEVEKSGLTVLGLIPAMAELTHFSVDFLTGHLFAKVLTGEGGLGATVHHIYVGAVSVNTALRNPARPQKNILTVTSGDRTDVILAALENNSVGVVLTNNILPPPNIIAKAAERNIPLLVVSGDTYETARQINHLQPLLSQDEPAKIALLEKLVRDHVDVAKIADFG
jgi:hypothetical protein